MPERAGIVHKHRAGGGDVPARIPGPEISAAPPPVRCPLPAKDASLVASSTIRISSAQTLDFALPALRALASAFNFAMGKFRSIRHFQHLAARPRRWRPERQLDFQHDDLPFYFTAPVLRKRPAKNSVSPRAFGRKRPCACMWSDTGISPVSQIQIRVADFHAASPGTFQARPGAQNSGWARRCELSMSA